MPTFPERRGTQLAEAPPDEADKPALYLRFPAFKLRGRPYSDEPIAKRLPSDRIVVLTSSRYLGPLLETDD